jgi:hypothetical protein
MACARLDHGQQLKARQQPPDGQACIEHVRRRRNGLSRQKFQS